VGGPGGSLAGGGTDGACEESEADMMDSQPALTYAGYCQSPLVLTPLLTVYKIQVCVRDLIKTLPSLSTQAPGSQAYSRRLEGFRLELVLSFG